MMTSEFYYSFEVNQYVLYLEAVSCGLCRFIENV